MFINEQTLLARLGSLLYPWCLKTMQTVTCEYKRTLTSFGGDVTCYSIDKVITFRGSSMKVVGVARQTPEVWVLLNSRRTAVVKLTRKRRRHRFMFMELTIASLAQFVSFRCRVDVISILSIQISSKIL